MFYLIGETITPCDDATARHAVQDGHPCVAVLTPAEWHSLESSFDMGIDFEPDVETALDTQAEVNYDSITGTVFIPDRANPDGPEARFAFALDERGVIFIDAGTTAKTLVEGVRALGRRRNPGLEHFLADFFSQIVAADTTLLRACERELDRMEDAILADEAEGVNERVNEIRNELRDLDDHYNHLMDLAEVLEDNENGFFSDEGLRYFRVLYGRFDRLRDQAKTLRDQTLQIRDTYKMHLDIRQNHIITVLTVVTAIFAPLTLIAGWYGMNFTTMPELTWRWGYLFVIALCLVVTAAFLIFFKRKKWL